MPSKLDKVRLPAELDRRRKLADETRKQITELSGTHSKRSLSRLFGLSPRTIAYVVHPERYTELLENNRGRWPLYYNREKNTAAIREHRRYKREVMKERAV